MAFVDLHLHSNKSDGEYAPHEVIRFAHAAGLRVVALTDHDTLDGLRGAASTARRIVEQESAEMHAENAENIMQDSVVDHILGMTPSAGSHTDAEPAKNTPFTFIGGIEITTEDAHEQHILGYFINPDNTNLKEYIVRLLEMRHRRVENIFEYLSENRIRIKNESRMALMNLPYVGRPQIAAMIVDAGYANSLSDAFDQYLTGAAFRKVPRPKPLAEEAIHVIREAGGVAVLAHPHSLRLDNDELSGRLKILKDMGLAGVECHYGIYDEARTNLYRSMALDCGLVVTGGSDFHGERIKPDIKIGTGKNGMLNFDDAGVTDALRWRRRDPEFLCE